MNPHRSARRDRPDGRGGRRRASPSGVALPAAEPAVAMARVHASIDGRGVTIRDVDAVSLELGKPVVFKLGGLHVMLMDLKAPLKPGAAPLALTFEHAQPRTFTVTAEPRFENNRLQHHSGAGGTHDQTHT